MRGGLLLYAAKSCGPTTTMKGKLTTTLKTFYIFGIRLLLKCDGTRAETRFHLSAKQTSPFKSAGASVQSTTDNRGVRISGSNARYTMFRGSVKGTVYPLHSPVSPSLPLPCVTVCHHVSTGLYLLWTTLKWDSSVSIVFHGERWMVKNSG
jgi:hypothetical protein